jgi:putative colanic acid biosysnthesis UDP-glucose lipid carrier transferase
MAMLALLLAVGYVTGISEDYSRRVIISWAVLTPALLLVVLLATNALMRRVILAPQNIRTAVVAGVSAPSQALAERLESNPETGLALKGFFDDRGHDRLGIPESFPILGTLGDLPDYVRKHRIDMIFVALPIRHVKRVVEMLDDLRDSTASMYYLPDLFVFDLIQSRTGQIMGLPVVSMFETPFFGYRAITKRTTDVLFTLGILVAALPVMGVIALAIRLTSSGPALFRQRRYGLDGEEITVYKFRSMYVTEDGPQIIQATPDDPRVTPVGRILRKYSLDELPQLFNVLQGRMSLVGPRPHAVAHNEEYRGLIKGYMMRHKVLPGITGLAQVNGCRGETRTLKDMEARVGYDLEYLRRWTPVLDLKILALTVVRVFRDSKAY